MNFGLKCKWDDWRDGRDDWDDGFILLDTDNFMHRHRSRNGEAADIHTNSQGPTPTNTLLHAAGPKKALN